MSDPTTPPDTGNMVTTELIWTTAGWRTKHQIDVLNTISQLDDYELDILYTGLCDRLKRGDSSAGQVIRDLLNEPLLPDEVKDPLASAYKEACSPGDLPYGALQKDEKGNVKVVQFQRGLDGSFEPV